MQWYHCLVVQMEALDNHAKMIMIVITSVAKDMDIAKTVHVIACPVLFTRSSFELAMLLNMNNDGDDVSSLI